MTSQAESQAADYTPDDPVYIRAVSSTTEEINAIPAELRGCYVKFVNHTDKGIALRFGTSSSGLSVDPSTVSTRTDEDDIAAAAAGPHDIVPAAVSGVPGVLQIRTKKAWTHFVFEALATPSASANLTWRKAVGDGT